jgi:hypothetical protein
VIPPVQPVQERIPERLAGHLQLMARTARLDLDDPDVSTVFTVRAAVRFRFTDLVKSGLVLPPKQRHCSRTLCRLRQLRQDLFDAAQEVCLVVPEVFEERLEGVAYEPQLLLG